MKKVWLVLGFVIFTMSMVHAESAKPAVSTAVNPHKLQPIVITASRSEDYEVDVARSVTVIDESSISNSVARTIPELLKNETGVYVRDYLGNGKSSQVDIRGFGETAGNNTLVLIDGRRANQIDISGVDWSQINMNSIKRIEVVRGSQTVLYGDNAVGGVINIITKDGEGIKPEAGFSYKTGTYDYSSYYTFAQGGSKFLDYYIDWTEASSDGYRMNNSSETSDYTGSFTMKPAPNIKLKFNGGYHRDWYGMPGALTQQNFQNLGRGGSAFPNDRAKTEDGYMTFGTEIAHDGSAGDVTFFNDIVARSRRTATVNYWSGGGGLTEFNNHIKTFGITPKLTILTEICKVMNKIVLGTDIYLDRDEILSGQGTKDLTNITKNSLGIYADDTIEITDNLTVNGGARMEWVKYDFDQQYATTGRSKKSPQDYSAEAGINYKYNEFSSLYANFSRSVRFPAVDEWYNALWAIPAWGLAGGGLNLDLEQQTGNQYEVGIKDNTIKQVSTRAALYIIDLKHELYYNPVTQANSIYDHTMRQGVEVEAHVYPVDKLDVFYKYTYEKAFFIGGSFNGNEIPMVPRYKMSGGISYNLRDCFNFMYMLDFVGSRRFISDQSANAPKMSSYITQDVKLTYYKYGFEIFCAFNNIANEKYSEYGVTNATGKTLSYYPSPGRNVLLGVSQKF